MQAGVLASPPRWLLQSRQAASPGRKTIVGGTLAAGLFDDAASEDAFRHLRSLQDIASLSGGNRAAGTPGYDRSAEYVAERLKEAGQRVRIRHLIVAYGTCTRF